MNSARELKRILWEGLLVAALGLFLALAANWISPRGLALSRNYFPRTTNASRTTNLTQRAAQVQGAAATNRWTPETVAAQLRAKGLQVIDQSEAVRLFRDARYEQELVVYVDARDDEHYQAGHIPGAYQFDYFYPQNYLPTLLPVCQTAAQIVVYCQGGNCEDSELAALMLKDSGVPREKLFVYVGGMTEWVAHQQPIEVGQRKSGTLAGRNP